MRLPLLAACLAAPLAAQSVPYTPGMVITRSTVIRPGTYLAVVGDSGVALVIRGSDVTVDLRGVELVGAVMRHPPDRYRGTAVRIEGGRNVTVRGLTARGFKVGIAARGTSRLRLLDNDLSYNWKPRLYSGIEKESLVDWLSYHQNEKDEWLRYGAGIHLADVKGGEVRGNIVRQGMNGLLLVRSDGLRIWNNDFSYNSGLGVGMYRASYDTLMHNRIDWNVRGYSHGFYNRGQDSAGLLMYHQSCFNVVAFNSITHSGDGLFLWAGQHTMDTGEGGANDNLFFGNDFSHAPTNGIEATFSRNAFVANRVEENWHGVWGGYSFGSVFLANRFRHNAEAIAIEHGQDNRIVGNSFDGDTTAIRLWWNRIEPSDWGYPKFRDTRSRDVVILGNDFRDNRLALRIDGTQRVRIDANRFLRVDSLLRVSGDTTGWTMITRPGDPTPVPVPSRYVVRPLPGGMDAMLPAGAPRGRKTIIVDDWGPWDGRSPKLWPVGRSDASPQRLRVMGPPGRWRIVSREGVRDVSAETGRIGDTLVVTPTPEREGWWGIQLEYVGAAVVTRDGERLPAGKPMRFSWSTGQFPITWGLVFSAYGSVRGILEPRPPCADPTEHCLTLQSSLEFGSTILAQRDTTRLDLTWYRPPIPGLRERDMVTQATAKTPLVPGRYLIRTIADDGVLVYLDGKLILDDWKYGESRVKEVEIEAKGGERLRVYHAQVDGWYEFRVDVMLLEWR